MWFSKNTIRADYEKVFSSVEGQRVLADLYKFCKTDAEMVAPNDPLTTGANVGRFRVAQHIAGMLSENLGKIFDSAKSNDLYKINLNKGIK